MQSKPQRTAEWERLIHAAHRFAKISHNSPIKLFSLLYKLDIKLFHQTGHSCTGETYYAMADGPTPGTLRSLLVMRDLNIDAAIGILTGSNRYGPWPFEPHLYCDRALAIMQDLETAHNKSAAHDLVLDDANAWWRVYTKQVGAAIPYEMTLPGSTGTAALDKSIDRKNVPPIIRSRPLAAPQANP